MENIYTRVFVALVLLAYVTIQSDAANCNTGSCPDLKYTNTEDKCTVGQGTCVCTDTTCTCSAGYTLDGASGSATCKLTAPTVTGPGGSTDVVYGQDITLTCEPAANIPAADIASNEYGWIVGSAAVETGTSTTRTLSGVTQNTAVKCSIGHADTALLNSPESAAVTVTVTAGNAVTCATHASCTNNNFLTGTCSVTTAGVCTCDDNACTCVSGARLNAATDGSCVPNGLSCTSNTQCDNGNTADTSANPYSTCNTDLGVCLCATGYYASGESCMEMGKSCTSGNAATQCDGTAYTGACDSTGHCTCATNYAKVFDDCGMALGKPCTEATKSVDCNGDKYTGVCTSSRCVCATGKEQIIGDCSGATTVVGSLLILALATITSRLF